MLQPGDQVIRHVPTSAGDVAFSEIGSGPPLILGGWWSSHLTLNWADPLFRGYISRLAEHFTVIRYELSGRGASGRVGSDPLGLDAEIDVMIEFVDALALNRFAVVGGSSGSAVAAGVATRQPRRVHHLVLYGAYARGCDIASGDARRALVDAVATHWGLGSRLLADIFLPGASSIDRDRFARFQRQSATAAQAAASLKAAYALDATEHFAALTVPTTVIHRRNDRAIPLALGLDVARRVRRSVMVELPGENHFPWLGDAESVADATLSGLGHRVGRRPVDVGRHAVTDREREVLAYVAQGLTDDEIAQRLSLSPHTVHRHVSNARTKLGVRSRAAAAAALRDRPITSS